MSWPVSSNLSQILDILPFDVSNTPRVIWLVNGEVWFDTVVNILKAYSVSLSCAGISAVSWLFVSSNLTQLGTATESRADTSVPSISQVKSSRKTCVWSERRLYNHCKTDIDKQVWTQLTWYVLLSSYSQYSSIIYWLHWFFQQH